VATAITRFLSTGLHWSEAASFAWAAGLIEGDGCITSQRGYPVVEVSMTDQDVVSAFAAIVGASTWGPYPRKEGGKAMWRSRVTGIDRLTDLYRRVEPFLGARRRGRFQEVLLGCDERGRISSWQRERWLWTPWAAGLFEAEGCISVSDRSPKLILECGDRDAVVRFGALVGGRVRGPFHRGLTKSGEERRPTYRWQVGGLTACMGVATRLRPWLGARRRARLDELISDRRDMKAAGQAALLAERLWD